MIAIDLETSEEVAVKIVLCNYLQEELSSPRPQLIQEAKTIRNLIGKGKPYIQLGIPIVYWFGTEGDFNIMAMELLGPSLENLLGSCKGKFSLKTTLMVGDQLVNNTNQQITLLEHIHSKNIIHRDIKQENILI